MPCCGVKSSARMGIAPRPVRPLSMKYHGLFSMSRVAQHLIFDNKWTPDSLSEQFRSYTQLLKRRVIYNRHETRSNRKRLSLESAKLKSTCFDGRIKLKNVTTSNNAHKIRNLLSKNRGLQRLYQNMPIHLIVDNINQRTFVMRKERDRLYYRMKQRKDDYKTLLIQCADVENRIRYENEFILQEEIASQVLRKKIENSNIRVKAILTINNTYKKLVQVLMNDEIFYEPILRSLEGDMEDQANFIKHVIYLGKPALANLKALGKEYQTLHKKCRQNTRAKLDAIAALRKPPTVYAPPTEAPRSSVVQDKQHYVRQTKSMRRLRVQLDMVERTIKNLKFVTLCSEAKEIYPRVRLQMENNRNMKYIIETEMQLHKSLRNKVNYCTLLREVLVNNLSEEEINRLERIRELKLILIEDDKFEMETINHLKSRSHIFALLRVNLWNLIDIVRAVDRQPRMFNLNYKSSYLKLPLLKFEMLDMKAAVPEFYQEDLDKVMTLLKQKVYKLVKAFKRLDIDAKKMAIGRDKYHAEFLTSKFAQEGLEGETQEVPDDNYEKAMAKIPNSKLLKGESAKLCEIMRKIREE